MGTLVAPAHWDKENLEANRTGDIVWGTVFLNRVALILIRLPLITSRDLFVLAGALPILYRIRRPIHQLLMKSSPGSIIQVRLIFINCTACVEARLCTELCLVVEYLLATPI